MKLLRKIMIMILCISSLAIFSACGKVEYSVKDFTNVTVVGYTEHGRLDIKVDDLAINKIYADGKKDKTAALRFAESFKFDFEGKSDEDSYFSNGDVVTINVTYDEGLAAALDLKFIDSSFEYTIEGLEDKVEMSPFDGLSLKFNGVAPYGSVQIDKSNCIQYIIDNVTFYCDNHDLSNGDKIVVRAEFNKDLAERNGYVFTEDVKKYTVVGLSKYVSTMMGVSYDTVTAKMRYMVREYVEGTETAYKSLNWYFGDDTDEEYDPYSDSDQTSSDSTQPEGEQEDGDGEDYNEDFQEERLETEEYTDVESKDENGSKVKKRIKVTDVMRIKNDFMLSNFNASFEYEPVGCYYSLNSLQYSDNLFTAVYKVTGTFVCQDSGGSGFIKPGDTVVGELYVTSTLDAGSVDMKNNLVYEDTTLANYHAYSIKSFEELEDVESEFLGSPKYLVEKLDYIEDAEAFDAFEKKQKSPSTSRTVSHVTEQTDSDTDKDESKTESEDTEEGEDIESQDTESEEFTSEDEYYNDDIGYDPYAYYEGEDEE